MKKNFNKSMVEFVKDQENEIKSLINHAYYVEVSDISWKIVNYALSQTLHLGHFIPCDENDVPLEKPKNYEAWISKALNTPYDADLSKYEKYQQACDRVLFEGFKLSGERFVELENDDLCIDFSGKNIVVTDVLCVETTIYTMEHLIEHQPPLTDNGAKFF